GDARLVEHVLMKQTPKFVNAWIGRTLAKDLSDESLARVTRFWAWTDIEDAIARAMRLPNERCAYVLANIALMGKAQALPALRENLDSVEAGSGRETLLTIMGNLHRLGDPIVGAEWLRAYSSAGNANATKLPPTGLPDFPPPAEITTNCRPSTT
ncbi:MAG: hypothetical protein ACI9MB_002329, partial [Verrucomicrobiales bacterium]